MKKRGKAFSLHNVRIDKLRKYDKMESGVDHSITIRTTRKKHWNHTPYKADWGECDDQEVLIQES